MTDLATIRIPVDSSDMLRAVKDAKALEMGVKTLVQAHNAGAIDLKQFNSGIVQLKRNYQSTFGVSSQKATAEIRKFSKAVRESVPHVNQAASGLNKFGVVAQQTGYQVSDFIVQVQGGTNPLVAFSQQATQLAGLLYYMPERFQLARLGVLGFSMSVATAISVVTIGIPLLAMLAMSFFNSGEKADKAAEGVDRYKKALDDLKSATEAAQTDINKLTFGTEDPAIANARQRQKDAQEEIAKLKAEAMRITARGVIFDPTDEQKAAIENALTGYRDITIELNNLTFKQSALNEAQRMLNGHLSTAKGLVASEADERARHKAILDGINATENDRKNIFHALAGEAGAVSKYMDESFQAGLKLSGLDMATPITAAGLAAQELANKLGISVGLAAEIGRISAMNADQKRIYSGVKSGLLPDVALRGVGLGGSSGFTTDVNAPIEMPGAMPPNPTKPKSGGGDKKDPLEQLRQQITLENELLGLSEAQARVIQALGKDRSKYSEAEINAITAEIEAYNQKQEAIERTKNIMDTVKSSMEDAFMSMVDGTKSAKDAFKSMAAEIIKELYRVLVVQQLVNSISGAIGGIFGGSSAPTSSPRPMPRPSGVAVGGSIMAGGSYLVGEHGPELVIPRHSGTVVNANQTAAMGGGSGTTVVNNNISVTGSDAAMVRTEIAKMIPQITNATKAAVIDAKQRGGQMAQAFR